MSKTNPSFPAGEGTATVPAERTRLARERSERKRLKLEKRRKASRSPFERYIASFDDPADRARARLECSVEPRFDELMTPLEAAIYGRTAEERYGHDDDLLDAFKAASKRDDDLQNVSIVLEEAALGTKAKYMLEPEFLKVVNTARLAMHLSRTCFTSMMTLRYGTTPQEKVVKLRGTFLNQCQKWLETNGHEGYRFHHLYVHENARDTGIHTHVLFELPKPKRPLDARGRARRLHEEFRLWANRCWAEKVGLDPADKPAWLSNKNPIGDAARADQQWTWVRYICKTLDPELNFSNGMSETTLRRRLKLPHNHAFEPVEVQRVKASQSLSDKACAFAVEELLFEPYMSASTMPSDWDSTRDLQLGEFARHVRSLSI